jgi:hypothetical protein
MDSKNEKDDFLKGVCVALQVVSSRGDSVTWGEIVIAVGVDSIINYAAFIEREEWELAGFYRYAESELGRRKPRKPLSR